MHYKALVRLDKRTKNLAKRMKHGEIALIDHVDIDSVAASMLVEAKVGAVINVARSCSGMYPNLGPKVLLDAGIYIIDNAHPELFNLIKEGDLIEISDGAIKRNGEVLGTGTVLTKELAASQLEDSKKNLSAELERFAKNTLGYVTTEKSLLLDPTVLPDIKTKINGRHVLVVVRGEGYKEDLAMISTYIRDMKPVLIGVDGGGDALLELGYKPDIIIGDMDSISDRTLTKSREIIVHAYTDGRAPGLPRIQALGLDAMVCPVSGTSEDLALLLAYEKGAEMITAVGTHSTLIDFLDKGRKGMSSTFLVRLKVGHKLVDARGVSKLYQAQPSIRYIGLIMLAALLLLMVVIAFSPSVKEQIHFTAQNIRSQLWQVYTKLHLWEWRN